MHLIRLLADGEFHSGEELGEALGISRAAVWKQLAVWRKKGLHLDVVQGKGYRLAKAIEWWSAEKLKGFLSAEALALLCTLRIEERVVSTNDEVMALMRQSVVPGVVCLAEEQTMGRGRRGREWLSPIGGNFYGSLGWVFPAGVSVVEGLSLAVGVAVVRALQRYGVSGVGLKWPNDIMIGQEKLGGVLIELQAESDGPCLVVVGLGLNLHLPDSAYEALDRPVTDLSRHLGRPVERNRLGALLLDELLVLLSNYPESGFAACHKEWLELDVLNGAQVEVSGLDRPVEGVARGVDTYGALRVETVAGSVMLHGGEVSLRKSTQ